MTRFTPPPADLAEPERRANMRANQWFDHRAKLWHGAGHRPGDLRETGRDSPKLPMPDLVIA